MVQWSWRIGTLLVLVSCTMHCGGSVAPTGGTSSPIAVELPAITIPTTLGTSVASVTQASSVNQLPEVSSAFSSATQFQQLQQNGPEIYERVSSTLDRLLSVFAKMSCTTTQCSFSGTSGETIKANFGSFSFSAPFSANVTGLGLSRTCVDIDQALTASTAYCVRVWTGSTRYLIGQFTTRPTSTDKGAGWFVATDSRSNEFGVIYDKSTATAASTSGPQSIIEFFVEIPGTVTNSHYSITETAVSGTSTALINYREYGRTSATATPMQYTARWLDKWFGNITLGSDSGTNVCSTLAGVETTGCSSTLTSPVLPAFLGSAADADHKFPAVTIFPAAPTF